MNFLKSINDIFESYSKPHKFKYKYDNWVENFLVRIYCLNFTTLGHWKNSFTDQRIVRHQSDRETSCTRNWTSGHYSTNIDDRVLNYQSLVVYGIPWNQSEEYRWSWSRYNSTMCHSLTIGTEKLFIARRIRHSTHLSEFTYFWKVQVTGVFYQMIFSVQEKFSIYDSRSVDRVWKYWIRLPSRTALKYWDFTYKIMLIHARMIPQSYSPFVEFSQDAVPRTPRKVTFYFPR